MKDGVADQISSVSAKASSVSHLKCEKSILVQMAKIII